MALGDPWKAKSNREAGRHPGYDMNRRGVEKRLRARILERDGHRCTMCGATEKSSGAPLEVDHIKAARDGGMEVPSNLRTLCRACNRRKEGSQTGRKEMHAHFASIADARRAPLGARKYALDLIPASAYWREDTPDEAFYDFAAVEAEEGADLQGSRLRIGIILAASMELHVAWVRSLTPGKSLDPPLAHERELGREFFRLATLAWFRGSQDVRRTVARATGREGESPLVGLSSAGVARLESRAALSGTSLARSVADGVRLIALGAFLPDGSRAMEPKELEDQIRTYYASSWIEPAPVADPGGPGILELAFPRSKTREERIAEGLLDPAGRRKGRGRKPGAMRVRDREQYDRFRRSRVPYSKWIKQTVEQIQAEILAPVQVPRNHALTWLQTERTRYRAAGAIEESRADARVASLQYTSKRDSRVCPTCAARDGIIRPKDDPYWATGAPPLHFRCRCDLVPVLKSSKTRVTPKRKLPRGDDLQPGFGAYDRTKVQAARTLGVIPSGPARR